MIFLLLSCLMVIKEREGTIHTQILEIDAHIVEVKEYQYQQLFMI